MAIGGAILFSGKIHLWKIILFKKSETNNIILLNPIFQDSSYLTLKWSWPEFLLKNMWLLLSSYIWTSSIFSLKFWRFWTRSIGNKYYNLYNYLDKLHNFVSYLLGHIFFDRFIELYLDKLKSKNWNRIYCVNKIHKTIGQNRLVLLFITIIYYLQSFLKFM